MTPRLIVTLEPVYLQAVSSLTARVGAHYERAEAPGYFAQTQLRVADGGYSRP